MFFKRRLIYMGENITNITERGGGEVHKKLLSKNNIKIIPSLDKSNAN